MKKRPHTAISEELSILLHTAEMICLNELNSYVMANKLHNIETQMFVLMPEFYYCTDRYTRIINIGSCK